MITLSITSMAVNRIKESLSKDFSAALSEQIILQNVRKSYLDLENLNREGYIKLVESIISDYMAIKPLGNDNADLKKREWLAAIDIMDLSISDSELRLV